MALQFRRGLDSDRVSITPIAGEPVFSTDTKTLFVGDGTTAGGNDIVSQKLAAVTGHIVPALDSTVDLGDSSRKFRDLYLSGNSIHLGDNLILSNQGGTFTAKDSSNNTINISLDANTTTDLAEGTNKYFTTARADSDARSALLVTDAGGDGSLTYDSGSGVFTYTGPSAAEVRAHFSAGEGIDIASGAISAEDATVSNKGIASFNTEHFSVSSGAVSIKTDGIDDTHIDFGTGTNQVSTADIPEQTNLYYTQARADARVNAILPNTGSLTEGSNLYFTNARADARITNALLDEDNMASNSATKIPSQQSVKAYVDAEVAGIVDTAPAALNTLNELAAALGDDANFSTTITNSIAAKLDSSAAISLIDSAYVQARTPAGTDSAATQAMIDSSIGFQVDSSYVQARQITPVSSFNTVTVATQNDVVSDTTAISYENTAQQAILQASNRGSGDYYGQRVAIDSGYAIVNATDEDTGGSNAGSVYVYVRSGTTWSQQQQITSPISPPDNHYFGTDLDIEGSRIVIGTKYDDTDYNQGGGVHVYTRSGTTWSLEQRLASTDIAANDWFGDRVAISGNYIVASAHKKNSSEGAVYVFKGATSTTMQGSSYDNVQSASINAIESQPKSMLFNSDGTKVYIVGMSSDAIKQYSLATPYDISTNFLSNASSSYSLTISGQNNMGVYAMRWNDDGTKVYVLCNNNMKIYQHNLTTAYDISTASYSNKNFSSTTQENSYNGFTFNNDGSSMYLVGNQSKVFQYTLSTPYDISTASYANKSFTHQGSHGTTQAIRFDGSGKKLFILGTRLRQHDLATAFDVSSSITVSYNLDLLGSASGAGDFTFNADMSKVYAVDAGVDKIFQFSTSGAATVWVQQAKLLASDNTTGDKFGFDVAISGDTIAIGAAVADTGGKVYAFTRSGTTWSQQAAFTSSDISSEDEFGGSVSISSDTILVGAYKVGGTSSAPHGAAYVFTRSGTTWSQQAKIQPSDTPNPSSATVAFAYRNVKIVDDIALIGHSTATNAGTANVGAAYMFQRNGTTWTQVSKFGASDATASDGFGIHADMDGRDIIVSAPWENGGRGQAYTFVIPDAAIYSDTLTLAAGSGITLTTNATTDTVTITGSAGTDSAATQAMIDSSIGFQVDSSYVQARQSAVGITIQEEGNALSTGATTLNFVGGSVTATGNAETKTVTISGGGSSFDSATVLSLVDSNHIQSRQLRDNVTIVLEVDSNLTSIDSAQVIHSFPKTQFRTVKYVAQLENDDSNGYHAEEILLTHNDTSVIMTSYAKITIDSDIGIFDATVDSNKVILTLSLTTSNTHVK